MTTDKRGKYFRIDRRKFEKVCDLGHYPAICYLVLSCGIQKDTNISTWGVNSIEKYAGIGRPRANRAFDSLKRHKHIHLASETIAGRARRVWRIEVTSEPDWVYLPNALIKSAMTEVAPIERLRKLGSVEAIRMLIHIYELQDLPGNGGLDWEHIRKTHDRDLITERGIFSIFGFNYKTSTSPWESPLRKQFGPPSNENNDQFWNTVSMLVDNGMLEWVRLLVERPGADAEIICPCPEGRYGTAEEREVTSAAQEAVEALLENDEGGPKYQVENYELVVPVPSDQPDVTVVSVLRTRYRAHTRKLSAWGAELQKCQVYITGFRDLADKARAGLSLTPKSPKSANVQLQSSSR